MALTPRQSLANTIRWVRWHETLDAALVGGSEFVIYNAENGKKIRALKLLDAADVDRWSE